MTTEFKTYPCRVEYEIEADSPQSAAMQLSKWMSEGMIYQPVVDVLDEDLNPLATIFTEDGKVDWFYDKEN